MAIPLAIYLSKPQPIFSADGAAQASDARLAEQAAHAGSMLEAAYKAGDRELALIWQAAMFAIVNLRRSRRFGSDIQGGGDSCGG